MNGLRQSVFTPDWHASPARVIAATWLIWALSWLIAAIWTRPTAARASFGDEAPYRIVTGLGAIALFGFFDRRDWGNAWQTPALLGWAMAALAIAGFGFAWWARLHLGTLWSGAVTRKQGHRVVESGPYALVRHPIYTGLLCSVFATAIARGRLEALIGAVLLTLGCWIKARLEERFLAQDLGAEYEAYRKRVRMLAPYLF